MEQATKAKINFREGTIELEGSEVFVKEHLNEFKDIFLSKNYNMISNDKLDSVPNVELKPQKQATKKSTSIKSTTAKKSAPKISSERFEINGGGKVPSLENYMEEKKPGNGNGNIVAVIGHYITEKLGHDGFTEGQIEYAYKMLKIKRPKHLRQIMINEKNKRDLFEPNSDDGSKWHLTRAGEIFVADNLPES